MNFVGLSADSVGYGASRKEVSLKQKRGSDVGLLNARRTRWQCRTESQVKA